ncbi:MAG: hypothetical protein NT175_08070 [Bacteroidetes bacterium]|nr:hypothetical protein [Bacteroidota bacterium]
MKVNKPVFLNRLPRITNWIIIIIVIFYIGITQDWNKPKRVIESDVLAYYLYLPAVIIHNDVTLDWAYKDIDFYRDKLWVLITPENKKLIQFTYGLSLLYSPFFTIAHVSAPLFGYDANGYSIPYKIALLVSCVFYLAIGLYCLRKILSRHFSPLVTSITLFAVVIGTNLLYYSTYEAPMSHAYNFSFIIIYLYLLIKWLEKSSALNSVLLGLVIGLITLIRPTNGLIIILFFLWGITSWSSFLNRLIYLMKSYWKILIMMVAFFVMWIPQFLYWHKITGSFFYFSYGDRAWFFFNDPQIINVLFSYRKGWLLYTPIMIFSLTGIPFLIKYWKEAFLPVLVFIVINIYIISSWCFWWYGGSFGLRAFVDSYGLLALPFAAFIQWVFDRRIVVRISFLFLITLMIAHNLFQIAQYRNGAIHYVSMTKKAYWESFGKLKPTPMFYKYLEFPDYKGVEEKIHEAKMKREREKGI